MKAVTMTVPVISTAHAPSHDALIAASDSLLVAYRDGAVYYVSEEGFEEPIEWMRPISRWVRREHPDSLWVHLDSIGDVIDELPVYEW